MSETSIRWIRNMKSSRIFSIFLKFKQLITRRWNKREIKRWNYIQEQQSLRVETYQTRMFINRFAFVSYKLVSNKLFNYVIIKVIYFKQQVKTDK